MKKILTIFVVAVVAYGVWSVFGGVRTEDKVVGAVAVRVAKPVGMVNGDTYTVGGTVRAADESTLAAQVSGAVTMRVAAGQDVAAGQVIATVSAPEYSAGVAQATAAAQSAEAAEAQARRNWDDLKPEAREQYVLASEQARAAVREAQSYAAKTVIRAPYAGTILATSVETGATVFPGAAIARIGQVDAREMVVDVIADVAAAVEVGQTVTVLVDGRDVSATVRAIARAANSLTHKAQVTLVFGSGAMVAPGAFAQAEFVVPQTVVASAQTVPSGAVVRAYDDAFVYVIGEDDVAHAVPVELGATDGETVAVSGAFAADAQIAITNAHLLADGMQVTVVE